MLVMQQLLILYASQTGCALDVAERLEEEARARNFSPRLFAMDEYSLDHLPQERLVVFVASTTGDGDAPDHMVHFGRFLRRRS